MQLTEILEQPTIISSSVISFYMTGAASFLFAAAFSEVTQFPVYIIKDTVTGKSYAFCLKNNICYTIQGKNVLVQLLRDFKIPYKNTKLYGPFNYIEFKKRLFSSTKRWSQKDFIDVKKLILKHKTLYGI